MPPVLRIENGSLVLRVSSESALFQMFATGFVLVQSAGEQGVIDTKGPTGPGAHSFGAHWGGDMGQGFALIGNTSYQQVWWAGDLKVSGSLTLTASMPSPVTLVRKFKMTGHLVGYPSNPILNPPPPIFDRRISGSGLAVIEYTHIIQNGSPVFDLRNTTYHFMP